MGFERVTLFGMVTLLVDAPAGGVLNVYTDLPGDALALRRTAAIPATVGRRPVRLHLPGSIKGRIWYPEIVTAGASLIVYGVEVWARVLPGPWQWYPVPVLETPEAWVPVKLPIPPTPEEWSAAKLPIPPTPEEWSAVKLPINPSSETPEWVSVAVDE